MQQPRRRAAVVVGGLLLAAAVTLVVTFVVGDRQEPTPAPPAPPTDSSTDDAAPDPADDTVLGVAVRSVEPCSLVDLGSLMTYGRVKDPQDLGEYASCTVDFFPTDGGSLRGTVEFYARYDPDVVVPGVVEQRGDISVYRQPGSDGVCQRTILLGDRTPIVVAVQQFEATRVDPCVVAETMTKTALTKLTTTGIGRRSGGASSSLTAVDTCTLVDPAALSAAGLDPSAPAPGFAHWYCAWGTTAGPALQVYIERQYERSEQGTRTTLAGREIVVQPGGYSGRQDRCVAQITQRRFLAGNGDQRVERIQIIFDGPPTQTPDELCRTVTGFAASAAAKLPAP